jgi:hypothetical protein
MLAAVDGVDVYPLLIVDVYCCRLCGCLSALDCVDVYLLYLSSVHCGMIIFCTLWMLVAVDCGCLSAVDYGCQLL